MRQSKLSSLEIGSLPTGNVLKDERVVIAVDGGRTPTATYQLLDFYHTLQIPSKLDFSLYPTKTLAFGKYFFHITIQRFQR